MKRRLNGGFALVAAAAILTALLCSSLMFFRIFQDHVFADLKDTARILSENGSVEKMAEEEQRSSVDGYRVTLIDGDGNAVYDNYIDASRVENQLRQPEVIQALGTGAGRASRRADRAAERWYFYAQRRENGTVLRVGKVADGFGQMILKPLPWLILAAAGIFAACAGLGQGLTRRFLEPIRKVAEHPEEAMAETYAEIRPLVEKIGTQQARLLDHMRTQEAFTANVTHELKTPLTAISGYAQLMETDESLPEEVCRYSSRIHEDSNRLLAMVDDILSLSKLDAREGEIERETVDLYELAKIAVQGLSLAAAEKEIQIILTGKPLRLKANRKMMKQVLTNLLDNAIRYGQEGGCVWVEVSDHLEIKDTGIGIPKEQQGKIFERFYRVDPDESHRRGGTGLGLAIVSEIVEAHGAQIAVSGDVGVGTTFTVTFPEEMTVREGEDDVSEN
ncbi:MAG: hypothetical protein IJM26_11315 [Lachnospiraceae bacterium]|nr:hypothetical protein [Lachnospiraceae bacterium]